MSMYTEIDVFMNTLFECMSLSVGAYCAPDSSNLGLVLVPDSSNLGLVLVWLWEGNHVWLDCS